MSNNEIKKFAATSKVAVWEQDVTPGDDAGAFDEAYIAALEAAAEAHKVSNPTVAAQCLEKRRIHITTKPWSITLF